MQGTGPGGGVCAGADRGGTVVVASGCAVKTVEVWVGFAAVVAEGVVGGCPPDRVCLGRCSREAGGNEGKDRGLELLFGFNYIGSSL